MISNNHYRYLQWTLQDYVSYNAQAVIPMEATNLQAAFGDNVVKVMKANSYLWVIRSGDEGYT
jgi:hypothetical protein